MGNKLRDLGAINSVLSRSAKNKVVSYFGESYLSGVSAPASPSVYGAEYQAVLDRSTFLGYSLPSTAVQIAGDTLIKAIGPTIWAKLKLFRVYNGPNANFIRINWKNPSSNLCSILGGVIFTAYHSVQGNNTDAYIDENFLVANEGLSAGSQSYGMFYESSEFDSFNAGNNMAGGVYDNLGNGATYMYPTGPIVNIGSVNYNFISPPGLPPMMLTADRYSTTSHKALKNGVSYNDQNGTNAITGTGLSNDFLYTFARDIAGFPDFWNADLISLVYYGDHLTDAEHQTIYTAFSAYRAFTQSLWSPSDLTPTSWFDNTSMVADGSQWTDRMGNYTVTQAIGGNRPGYNASYRNGLPAFTFNGSTQFLAGNRPTLIRNKPGFFMWAVGSQIDINVDDTTASPVERIQLVQAAGGEVYLIPYYVSGNSYFGQSPVLPFTDKALLANFDGTQATDQKRISIFDKDNIKINLAYAGTTQTLTSPLVSGSNVLQFMKYFSLPTPGNLMEVGFINRSLTRGEMAQLANYLKTKYAL